MSVFGDESYKEEVYGNLHWIINGVEPEEDEKKQLVYLHETVMNLINGEYDKVSQFIIEWGQQRNMTHKQMAEELSEVYHVMVRMLKF